MQQMDTNQNFDFVNDSLSKKDSLEKDSIEDQLELLGNISNLPRDAKKSNRYSGVKSMLEDVAASANSEHHKKCGMQSPSELLQTISNVFNRNHYPFQKRLQ